MTEVRVPRALTIAGSDSGGGAGIQADLKTFQELGVYGMSAITAITVQNTLGVHGVYPLPPEAAAEQIKAVGSDLGVDALKTGMLFNAEIIRLVANQIHKFGWEKVVVDPVMIAKGGAELLQNEAVLAMKEHLLPLALVVTPNIPEAEVLAGMRIRTMEDRREAARRIHALGPKIVVIKGGHDEGGPDREDRDHEEARIYGISAGADREENLEKHLEEHLEEHSDKYMKEILAEHTEEHMEKHIEVHLDVVNHSYDQARTAMHSEKYSHMNSPIFKAVGNDRDPQVIDLIYDGAAFTELSGKRVNTVQTHGTGCTFSAAIAAGLAQGMNAFDAIRSGRSFIQAAIEDGLNLGQGHGPTNHWAYQRRQGVLR
ncbi:bifunctional hydroxymethylpyrimidine kinase/phosphomethylpyrimidine kinase [Paenibacillus glucanolyticus]|uniref:bifunctional hydroxymethylpyrimidine kinase/phosphomethylpyrimidine kinase n=1 Tax=Paenibacillus glucanolyticus TaxID=59843 RepID=UPI00096FF504|nr:bifunctional hydroxymethylpyrimidine kinase/phosphomethylpyrimidine kinase [Paenibacillus glucanolyticus]OMF74404.1 bifunctional hydroxymethylpyrimidine kinase/phosphomethylpyrimidine kinase [Paenibacillus glucanolyticus]